MCEVDQGKQVRLVCCEALEKFRTAADARPKVQKRKKKLLLMVSVGVGVGVGVVVAWLACVGLCGASDVPCGQRSNAELVLDTSTGQRTCVCVANHVCSLVGPSGAKAYCGAGTINIGECRAEATVAAVERRGEELHRDAKVSPESVEGGGAARTVGGGERDGASR